jgi:hypothetical protein
MARYAHCGFSISPGILKDAVRTAPAPSKKYIIGRHIFGTISRRGSKPSYEIPSHEGHEGHEGFEGKSRKTVGSH